MRDDTGARFNTRQLGMDVWRQLFGGASSLRSSSEKKVIGSRPEAVIAAMALARSTVFLFLEPFLRPPVFLRPDRVGASPHGSVSATAPSVAEPALVAGGTLMTTGFPQWALRLALLSFVFSSLQYWTADECTS